MSIKREGEYWPSVAQPFSLGTAKRLACSVFLLMMPSRLQLASNELDVSLLRTH